MLIFLIIGALVGAAGVIFALQNIVPITVTFFSWQLHGSLALVLILSMAIGVLVSLLITIPEVVRDSIRFRDLKKQNAKLQEELAQQKAALADLQKKSVPANVAVVEKVTTEVKVPSGQ